MLSGQGTKEAGAGVNPFTCLQAFQRWLHDGDAIGGEWQQK
jgi:hypothetical protein